MPEQEDDPTEWERQRGLEKDETMKIIGDLIAGNKGRDIYRDSRAPVGHCYRKH
jgi:hypothetical protein